MKKRMMLITAACMSLCMVSTCALGAAVSRDELNTEKSGIPVRTMSLALVKDTSDGMNMYENSDFIEKEQPELSAETKELISLYQQNPSEENYFNLREKVIEDYNAVVERKEEKLHELKAETAGKPGGDEIVAEMQDLVQDIYITYWDRINSSMLRFSDPRLLKWRVASAARYEYIPVMGAGETIYVKRTPVTNGEYAQYIEATGAAAPSNWKNGTYPAGERDFPVNFVSYEDALGYCVWLTERDGTNTYRLPSESEWELAAGHMPKDADFNCGVNDGRTPVDEYSDVTRGAHGAVDFWGNVWEWTSTVRSEESGVTTLGVKGGSWASVRTDCRTEYRDEGRDASRGYEDVGFRVIQVLGGREPEQEVDMTTLSAPIVTASALSSHSIRLSWQSVEGAVEYQIFEYDQETGLVRRLDRASNTSYTLTGLAAGTAYSYIVQPLSYTSIGDNVSAEYSVTAVTLTDGAEYPMQFTDVAQDAWYADAVRYVKEKGLMSGTSETSFSPDAVTSRGMIVTILWRMDGSPAQTGASSFSDVADGQYYSDAAMWAAANRIVGGYEDGRFAPNDPITREQMAAMMYRFVQAKGWDTTASADLSGYTDAPQISTYALPALQWANAEGIISGNGTLLSPDAPATRAQAAAILTRFCEIFSV